MDLLTPIEASEYLQKKITPGTLRRWAAQGKITHTKIGAKIFFTKENLDDVTKLHKGNPTPDASLID